MKPVTKRFLKCFSKYILLVPALFLFAVLLGGCSAVRQIEGQAYAVTMAIDLDEDGRTTVSVQVPSLGGSASSEGEHEGAYVISSATGEGFEEALNLLNATVPRMLNLSQIKSLIIAEDMARREDFGDFLRELKQYHLRYGEAGLIICQGSARSMLERQQAIIGVRLSDSVVIALEQYSRLGTIPRATLSNVLYRIQSIYEDPLAILASVSGKPELWDEKGAWYAGTLTREGENKDEYYGAALLRGGQMVGRLTGSEMQLISLLRGSDEALSMICAGVSMKLERRRAPRISVDLSGDNPVIDVSLSLLVSMTDQPFNPDDICADLTARYEALTALCQSLSVEPFGYARAAAAHFPDIPSWQAYDWRTRFSRADVRYHISIQRAES